jgi:hypothetical protein
MLFGVYHLALCVQNRLYLRVFWEVNLCLRETVNTLTKRLNKKPEGSVDRKPANSFVKAKNTKKNALFLFPNLNQGNNRFCFS